MTNLRELQILFDQRVPMRDGITLSADVYLPAGELESIGQRPVIVTRTPYMKAKVGIYEAARYFVRYGYIFVAMDVRGRGDSEGVFVPYFNEGLDGYDAIEWCASQPWSDGNVGTIGASYEGRIQWLTAVEQPPHLKTMIVLVPPSDPFVETPTGVPSPMHLCWLHYVSGRLNQPMELVDWEQVYEHLPLVTMDQQVGRNIPRWRTEIEHAQLDDYWRPLCYQIRFEQVQVPVLHISGWYDDEQIGTPLNFAGMTANGGNPVARENQRLLMGSWGHAVNRDTKLGEVDFGSQAIIDLRGEQLSWYDRWLKQIPLKAKAPVRIFVMGENVWRDEQEWPLARTHWTNYYLHSGGRANSRFGDGSLSTSSPAADQPHDSYSYDPAQPVPFITDPTSSQIGGPDDYSALERRDDVLVYVTAPLEQAVEVTGPVRVDLYASSSAPDTDFMAMLLDVWPNGFRQRLCDGMVRARFRDGMEQPALIEPGRIYQYTIDCWNTAQVFQVGHRIALAISSSAFPKYDRNLNTGEPLGQTAAMAVAQQHIYHDAAHPSAVILPVIPRHTEGDEQIR
ncbi:hydrolase [Reticulibacter mediterranei]|uniref:Hydrolase n=1 Tax=Reticulibacter mediterranei TaxID=2778369 RepID=A0A8J3ITA1_9CHLR|nr:CocE/NonD family hydrolase [Reticulibacter mediterranei]GHO95806.1 hydrolase [Reticulibacter mediterranei]